ncbi:MAG: hydroxyethylthiazole kinase [Bilophila wadsworthia]
MVFDPVGVGASRFRNETAAMLLREVRFDVIKGNISEIAYLAEGIGTTKGVDANLDALSTEGNLRWHTDLARKVSTQTGAAIVISGPIDIVADSHEAWAIRNGHPMMANLGTGRMSAGSSAVAGSRPAGAFAVLRLRHVVWGFAGSWCMSFVRGRRFGDVPVLLMDAMSKQTGDPTPGARRTVAELRLRRAEGALYHVGAQKMCSLHAAIFGLDRFAVCAAYSESAMIARNPFGVKAQGTRLLGRIEPRRGKGLFRRG